VTQISLDQTLGHAFAMVGRIMS